MTLNWIEAKKFYSVADLSLHPHESLFINRQVAQVSCAITTTGVESFPPVRRAVRKDQAGAHQAYVAL